MYCTHCGNEIPDDSSFCTKCGKPLGPAGNSGPAGTGGPKGGKGKLAAIIAAVVVLVAIVVALCVWPGASGCGSSSTSTEGGSTSTASQSDSTGGSSSSAIDDAEYERALARIDGWWQSVGQSMSVYNHFTEGTLYVYQVDIPDGNSADFLGSYSYTVQPFAAGELTFTDNAGVAVLVDGGNTYILEDGDDSVLTCRNLDGSGYSGSSSLVRPSSGDISDALLAAMAQAEGGGSAGVGGGVTTPNNPASIDVSGGGDGGVATLSGVVERVDMTTADTGMAWGSVVYYLRFSSPVNITYNGPSGTTTQDFERIQVWTVESYVATGGEEAYLADHPEEVSSDYDRYVGQTITVSGHILDAGTAHYHGGGAFIDAEVVG